MRIAFTTKGVQWNDQMDQRFGRTDYLLVYDEDTYTLSHYDNREIADQAHGAGPQTAQKLFDLQPDILITGNGPGGNAAKVLEKAGLQIYIGAGEMNVRQAYQAYQKGELKELSV